MHREAFLVNFRVLKAFVCLISLNVCLSLRSSYAAASHQQGTCARFCPLLTSSCNCYTVLEVCQLPSSSLFLQLKWTQKKKENPSMAHFKLSCNALIHCFTNRGSLLNPWPETTTSHKMMSWFKIKSTVSLPHRSKQVIVPVFWEAQSQQLPRFHTLSSICGSTSFSY